MPVSGRGLMQLSNDTSPTPITEGADRVKSKQRFCSRVDCDRPVRGRELCSAHYLYAWRHGNLPPPRTSEERFWAKVERVDEPDACWLWIGARQTDGYGSAWFEGEGRLAHVVAYYLEGGEWPARGLLVRHRCD